MPPTQPPLSSHVPLLSRLPLRTCARGARPAPRLSSPAGRRASAWCLVLALLAAASGGWALIATGRALGALLTGAGYAAWLCQAVVSALLGGTLHAAAQLVSRTGAATQEAHLRHLVLGHLLRLGPTRAVDARSGATVSLLTDGAERVAAYQQTFLVPTAVALLGPLLVLVEVALAVDVVTPLVLGAAVVVAPACVALLHARLRRSSSQSRQARARLATEYLEAIQGLETLTLARAARRTSERLRQTGEASRRATMRVLAANQVVILVTDSLFSLLLIAAALLSVTRMSSAALDPGGALAVVLTSYVLLEPLDRVGAFFYVGMAGVANQRAIRELLARPLPQQHAAPACQQDVPPQGRGTAPEAGDAQDLAPGQSAPPGGTQVQAQEAQDPRAEIVLRDVQAGWDGEPVLHDVSLTVHRGQHVAVVGPSGAGKSTLMAMLAGNLLPSRGSLSLHGTRLEATSQDQVRAASALVAQSTWLFTGTIADNLRLARPQATETQMWHALEKAGLAEEVHHMPAGLDTQVGEAGLGLSGGQAQRVSLARAVLADRPLLLLDEPTSQVDLASEATIMEAVERLSAGRTVVTVSHREGAVAGADQVLTVAGGRVSQDYGRESAPRGARPGAPERREEQ